jgi:hypothetical protein
MQKTKTEVIPLCTELRHLTLLNEIHIWQTPLLSGIILFLHILQFVDIFDQIRAPHAHAGAAYSRCGLITDIYRKHFRISPLIELSIEHPNVLATILSI